MPPSSKSGSKHGYTFLLPWILCEIFNDYFLWLTLSQLNSCRSSFSRSSFSVHCLFAQPSPHTPQGNLCPIPPAMEYGTPPSLGRFPDSSHTKDVQRQTSQQLLWGFLLQKWLCIVLRKTVWRRTLHSSPARPCVTGLCWDQWGEEQGFSKPMSTTRYNRGSVGATGAGFFTKMGMSSRQWWEPQRDYLLRSKSYLSMRDARMTR